jgi:hypothetical protein
MYFHQIQLEWLINHCNEMLTSQIRDNCRTQSKELINVGVANQTRVCLYKPLAWLHVEDDAQSNRMAIMKLLCLDPVRDIIVPGRFFNSHKLFYRRS